MMQSVYIHTQGVFGTVFNLGLILVTLGEIVLYHRHFTVSMASFTPTFLADPPWVGQMTVVAVCLYFNFPICQTF